MRILLVATNRERSPFPVAPIGALCVGAAARAAEHQVTFLDLGWVRSPLRALGGALRNGGFDAVAFSIRNHDNCSFLMQHAYVDEIRQLADLVHSRFKGPLILGGSGFSVSPLGWIRRLGADYGVIGEGEHAFVELLARLGAGASAADISGVITADELQIVTTPAPAAPVADLDALAPPAHAWCRYSQYLARGGFVGVQTKRGCPFACAYCIYPRLEGRRYRLRSPERVVDEIQTVLTSSGSRHFFFVDSVFNDPRGHALAVCTALARRRLPARWMAFCNPVGFDAELARAMTDAGCVGIEFGLDAATEKMLAALGKPFGPAQIQAGMEAAHAARLPFAVHLLFGGPSETWDDAAEAQRFLNGCAPANGIFASFGLRIHEGTPLAALAAREGVLAPGQDLFEPAYYVSPAMARDPALHLDRIARRRPEWTSPVDWRKPVVQWTQKLMNFLGVRPQWRNIRNYGLHMRRGPGGKVD